MKKIFMFVCLAGLAVFSLKSDPVTLYGRLLGSGSMRTTSPQVEAFQDAGEIQLYFAVELGSLNVLVADEAGTPVYSQQVNAASGSTLIIETGTWCAGAYTLTITDGLGGSLEGSFVIN